MISTFRPMRSDFVQRAGAFVGAAVLVCVLVLVVVAVFGAGVAGAAPRGVVSVLGADGSGEGQFSFVGGVAVNQQTGDVYVVDIANERVQQLDADGAFIRTWGSGVVDGTDEHQVCTSACLAGLTSSVDGGFSFGFGSYFPGIAVDPTDGDVYVADVANNRIQQFSADGAFVRAWGVAGSGDGEFSTPASLDVDPTTGDVVVGDRDNGRIQRFTGDGVYLSQFPVSAPHDVAVDANGAIYTFEFGAAVRKFDAAGVLDEEFTVPYTFGFPTQVAAAGDSVFIVDPNENADGFNVFELAADSGEVLDIHRTTGTSFEASGLAANAASGRIYVGDGFNSRVYVLDDPVHTATIQASTDITTSGATLHGTVDPNGGFATGYHFEVSVDGETWTSFPDTDVDIGNGDDPVEVTAEATGLEANRLYHVRLVATKQFGSRAVSTGTVGDFTTDPLPPIATTLPASSIRSTAATLAGEIDPRNAETTYHFEWGNTTDYGNSIPIPAASAGAGGTPVIVTQDLTGLLSNTTYHYRVKATNEAGTTTGLDRTFTTRPCADCDGGDPPRGYELVSPADKVGGVGVGHWYGGPDAVGYVGLAAHDGERFAVRGQNGSAIANGGAFGYVNDWVFAERTPAGWTHRPGVSKRAYGPQPTTDISITGATSDLHLTSWGSGSHLLRLFPELESWNENITGSNMLLRQWPRPEWEVFGPTAPSQAVTQPGTLPKDTIGDGTNAFAADGTAVASTGVTTRGLADAGDASFDVLDTGGPGPDGDPGNIYLDEITGPFSDVFPGDDSARELVNVCTAGTILPAAFDPCVSGGLISRGGASLTASTDFGGTALPPNAMSADGSRLLFMAPDTRPLFGQVPDPPQVFIRQRGVDGQVLTRWISQSPRVIGQAGLLGPAFVEGASRNGDKVFFRTTSPLLASDPNEGVAGAPGAGSSDLYMYDLPDGPDGDPDTADADPAGGTLTRISAGSGGDSDCNSPPVGTGQPPSAVRSISSDGSRIYFTCAAPLSGPVAIPSGTITTPDGATSSTDAVNLYVYDAMKPLEQRWGFVARLPRGAGFGDCATTLAGRGSTIAALPGGRGNDFNINSANSCVRGTLDGTFVTFFTDGQLTADDPDAASGDMYAYDLLLNELTRVSAPRHGAGVPYPCPPASSVRQCFGDGGIGPGAMALEMLGVAQRPPPSRDRLAFFESRSRLVAEDADDAYDVYQWREGELTLISADPGNTDDTFYVGNDRSGLNVYLATRDQLTWQDRDKVLDVYTARLNGGIPQPEVVPSCTVLADGCQGGGAQPVQPHVDSSRPGGRNAVPGRRKVLSLSRLSAAQLRKAAHTGRVGVRVRASAAGKVSLVARSRIGRGTRIVGRTSKRLTKPGFATIGLRLSAKARAVLASGRPLRVKLTVSQAGVKSKSMTVRLKRNGK
ncbi:MAG TPA: hypothetical protein VEX36_07965 [Thermoleophilaceae bacterium]|nr:hypothetical protein [Thermoleophilaceae bacterium]